VRRRLFISAVVLFLLAGIVTILWSVLDWPPPRLILKYGLPPAGGPTGRRWTADCGIEFVEISPGYCKAYRPVVDERGTLLGRFGAILGVPIGQRPEFGGLHEDRWIEVSDKYWISTSPYPYEVACRRCFRLTFRTTGSFDWLSSTNPGQFRLPIAEELYLAAGHEITGSAGTAMASIVGPESSPGLVLYGTGWTSGKPITSEIIVKAVVSQSEDAIHECLYLVWIPPEYEK